MSESVTNSGAVKTGAAAGLAASVVVLIQWLLSLGHVVLPADVGAALVMIIAAGAHQAGSLIAKPKAPVVAKAEPTVVDMKAAA